MNRFKTTITGALVASAIGSLLHAAPVFAAGDFAVVSVRMATREAYQGRCNKVFVTVANLDRSNATNPAKGKLITHPQGVFNQQRAEKGLFVPSLKPGQKKTLTLSNVQIIPTGPVTMAAAFLTQGDIDTSNDSRSINLQVNRTCRTGDTRKPPAAGCDLMMTFTEPTGNTIAANDPTDFKAKVTNVGGAECPNRAVRLYQYSGSSASGYGTAVGGTSGSIRQIPELGANQSHDLIWSANPGGPGTFTYAIQFTGAHNDANNNNHRPKKTVTAN